MTYVPVRCDCCGETMHAPPENTYACPLCDTGRLRPLEGPEGPEIDRDGQLHLFGPPRAQSKPEGTEP